MLRAQERNKFNNSTTDDDLVESDCNIIIQLNWDHELINFIFNLHFATLDASIIKQFYFLPPSRLYNPSASLSIQMCNSRRNDDYWNGFCYTKYLRLPVYRWFMERRCKNKEDKKLSLCNSIWFLCEIISLIRFHP